MRKYIIVLIVLAVFMGCRDAQEVEQPQLGMSIEQKEFNVNPSGEIIHVKIKNTKIKPECEVSENAKDWIQLYSWGGFDEGNTGEYIFVYKVLANDDYEAVRSGSIRVTSGSNSDVVNIHQSGGSPILYMDENTIIVDSKGGEIVPVINANFDYSVEVLDAEWITVVNKQSTRGVSAYTLTLSIEPNTGFEGREGIIRIYDNNGSSSENLLIKQKQHDMIELDKNAVSVDDTENTFEISVHANVEYQVMIDNKWISQSQLIKESETTNKYLFKVNSLKDANNRQGKITFSSINSSENISYNVVVNQNSVLFFTVFSDSMVETEEKQMQFTNNTNQSLIWNSSNSSVASVDNNGNVKALKEGTTTISVSSSDYKHVSECKLSVTPCLSFISNPEWMIDGEQVEFKVENKSNLSITWNSSNPSVASVNNNGLVSALSVGKTTINVVSEDGNYKISSELTVKHISDVISISRTGVGIITDSSGSYFTSTYTIVNDSPNEITLISLGTVSLNNKKVSGNSTYEVTLQSPVTYPSASLILKFKHNGVQYSITSK